MAQFSSTKELRPARKNGKEVLLRLNRRYRFSLLLRLTVVSLLVSSCGYHMGTGETTIDKAVRTIFIGHFQNNTSEPYLETYFRKAFNNRLVRTPQLKLSADPEEADAVLKGAIRTVSISPVGYRSNNLAAIERITLMMDIVLEDNKTHKSIWRQTGFSVFADYDVTSSNLLVVENARKDALVRLADDTAERAFITILSAF